LKRRREEGKKGRRKKGRRKKGRRKKGRREEGKKGFFGFRRKGHYWVLGFLERLRIGIIFNY
jgi:hypothetical protein